jgi:hypothetical protein
MTVTPVIATIAPDFVAEAQAGGVWGLANRAAAARAKALSQTTFRFTVKRCTIYNLAP